MSELVYTPTQLPQHDDRVRQYLSLELQRLSAFISQSSRVPLFHLEPRDPEEGYLASADGVGWNPGSGAGLYIFRSGAWAFIV